MPAPDSPPKAEMPAAAAVRELLAPPLADLAESIRRLAAAQGRTGKTIHDLRVVCRRLQALLLLLHDALHPAAVKPLRKKIARLRRAAGAARDADVHLHLLAEEPPPPGGARGSDQAPALALAALTKATERERRAARRSLRKAARRADADDFTGDLAPLLQTDRAHTLGQVAAAGLPRIVRAVQKAARADLADLARVHALRVKLKLLRYALDALAPLPDPDLSDAALSSLRAVQRTLGAVNDADRLLARVAAFRKRGPALPPAGRAALGALERRQRAKLRAGLDEFRRAWAAFGQADILPRLLAAVSLLRDAEPEPSPPRPTPDSPPAPAIAPVIAPADGPLRLAAIDVGTNSIRLIVAEAAPDGAYRILDDEKETTRLGAGLDATGRLDDRAVRQSIEALRRMVQIAKGYGARHIRAVATSATRDAANGPAFAAAVRRAAGLELEVIPGEQEALLAYRSVAARFDLASLAVATLDIGGGSTDMVLASGGMVEKVFTLPIGAVRLTERFGGPEAAFTTRFGELRGHLRGLLRRDVLDVPFRPHLVIGTGGTFTTLANVALQRGEPGVGAARVGDAIPLGAAQGYEMKRSEVRRILDELRRMPLAARQRVPGLPAERADILPAGLAILHATMKRLGAKRLRVHDGGIRDGLLREMIAQAFPSRAALAHRQDGPLDRARRLADACRVDRRHADHVAALALRIFDQLADAPGAAAWFGPDLREARLVLHLAALLLDVGYLINYTRHHIHSYNLIRHSDLRGLTPRQVELVASVARYHRASQPKEKHPGYAAMAPADRALVRTLAGIVRVAVGLDRTHAQAVRDVHVALSPRAVRFALECPVDPAVDIWGASRKAGLLELALERHAEFVWQRPEARPSRPPRPARPPRARRTLPASTQGG